jgi:hypothetical protein
MGGGDASPTKSSAKKNVHTHTQHEQQVVTEQPSEAHVGSPRKLTPSNIAAANNPDSSKRL